MYVLILGLLLVAAMGIGIGVARAASVDVNLAADQTVSGPYIRAGENVTIRGTVNGDVLVAGSEVTIDGTVNGNIYAAGSKVRITGKVTGNTHAAGSEVSYSAQSAGSVFLVGSNVALENNAELNTAYLAGSSIEANGKYAGNVDAAGSQISIIGQVAHDVALAGTDIRIKGGASVGGNVKYSSATDAVIDNDQAIKGTITHVTPPKQSASDRVVGKLLETLFWLAANMLVAASVLWFLPGFLRRSEAAYMKAPVNAILKALAFVFLIPVGLIFGLFTLIGIPLMILLGLVYVLTLMLAPTAAAHWLGTLVWERQQKTKRSLTYQQELAAVGLGLLIVAIVNLLPIVGGIFSFALFLIGVGILIARGFAPLGYKPKARGTKAA